MAQIAEKGKVYEAEKYFEAFLQVLEECVVNKEEIKLHGYFDMTFVTKEPRKSRNPFVNEEILLPEKDYIKIKLKKTLKDLLNE